MLFNFQGTRPVRCSQRRIFILAHLFGFVKGFFFLLPKALPSPNPLPRPFFRSFGWVAVSLFLSEAARLVYHIRRPLSRPFSSQPIFLRPGSGVFVVRVPAVLSDSFVSIPCSTGNVKAFLTKSLFFFGIGERAEIGPLFLWTLPSPLLFHIGGRLPVLSSL